MSSARQPHAQPQPDLSICDREPIHIPGSIEPNGVLVAFREPDMTIVQVSANAETIVGTAAEALLGLTAGELFDSNSLATILRQMQSGNLNRQRRYLRGVQVQASDAIFDASLHRHQGVLIVELEPDTDTAAAPAPDVFASLTDAMADLTGRFSLVDLCQRIAAHVRRLTGFDRVMVYRFLEDDTGAVIAEDRRTDLVSYLGLRYPASDIPAQARRLYLVNALRLKADVNAPRSVLVPVLNPDTGQPLDMTYCVLRAMSPVHDEYLRNMGVTASMSVSIVKDDRLWGLVACHHTVAKTVPHQVRMSCEMLARIFSTHIAAAEEEDTRREAGALQHFRDELAKRLRSVTDVGPALIDEGDRLKSAINADGAAICIGDQIELVGDTPQRDQVAGIVQWLDENQREYVFYTDKLSDHCPAADCAADVATGLLSARIALGSRDFLLWFRRPVLQVVEWAGNPAKPAEETEAGNRISPRLSFERWKQTVGDRSQSWRLHERDFAIAVRQTVAELLLVQQNEQVTRLNLELERSNIELDAFAYAASHDLQEPIRTLRSYTQLLSRRAAGRLNEDDLELLRVMEAGADRMANLVSSLLAYGQVGGTLQREWKTISLEDVLRWSLLNLEESIRRSAAEITHEPLPVVSGDAEQITQVMQNLIGNSIKYRKPDQPLHVHVSALREDKTWRFGVHDNGQGFEPEQSELIFQAFKRLHGRDVPGSGIGLALCRRIVEHHGGQIWAEAKGSGRGATFWFTLPAS